MTVGQFANMVEEMRKAQKKYWEKKSYIDYENMVACERRVDKALKEHNARKDNANYSLFGD